MACIFLGNVEEPAPWLYKACGGELSVPAGCPITFVTAADVTAAEVSIDLLGSNDTRKPIDSDAMLFETVLQTYALADQSNCSCAVTPTTIAFQRFSVRVPSAAAGDRFELEGFGNDVDFQITTAAPCGPLQWPPAIDVSVDCERCAPPPPPDAQEGCGAAGAPAFAIAGLALLVVTRRRRA
jgi:uncharacterized protein (TIGR03382 family)